MGINKIAQTLEINFWKLIIPIIQEEGPLMKTIRSIKKSPYSKLSYIAILIFLWAAIGLVSGIILGRLFVLFQIL